MLRTDLHTPASAYTTYFPPLTTRLNKAFPVGNSPWDLFKPTPNETQLLIHSIPLAFLPSDNDQLFPSLHESIRNARGVSILSVRYLNLDTGSSSQKKATSLVVFLALPDAFALLPSFNLFSRNRRVEQMFSSSRDSQCKKCWKFSNISNRCPSSLPVVPSARSPLQRQSIAALTIPALRVATFNRSLPAAHPQWRAVLTAKKSTLRTAGIAPPSQKTPQIYQRCYLDRRRTAGISLMTRLALRWSFVQHHVPLLTPCIPLYSPTMLCHLGKEPTAP